MSENKRFMVDDAGTLIDMETRNTYDYVGDVVDLLNELAEGNEELRTKNNAYIQDVEAYREENTHLKLGNEQIKEEIKDLNDILARYEEKELQRND